MALENVTAPEIDLLKRDEYYLLYELMIQSLKTDNVSEGLNTSLNLLRQYLQSGNIVMYKKKEDGTYIYKKSDVPMPETIKAISCIVNRTSPLAEKKGTFKLDLSKASEILKNMMLINFNTNDGEYIISINNYTEPKTLDPDFWDKVKETFRIIIKRAESYEKNTQAMSLDVLTGLDNRNSYERTIEGFDINQKGVVYGIFDLFRLKHVNDAYNHSLGDKYISETAKILNKYWPKYKVTLNDDGTETYKETGDCVYRIGGDEFAVITRENVELTKLKASVAAKEVALIDLGMKQDEPIGLNVGVVEHIPGTVFKDTYDAADAIMEEDKKEMYAVHGLERRK